MESFQRTPNPHVGRMIGITRRRVNRPFRESLSNLGEQQLLHLHHGHALECRAQEEPGPDDHVDLAQLGSGEEAAVRFAVLPGHEEASGEAGLEAPCLGTGEAVLLGWGEGRELEGAGYG